VENREKKVSVAALLMLAGGVIGASIALLFAPQSGVKTRGDILRYSKRARHKADEFVNDLAENVSNMVEAIGAKSDDLMEKGKDAAGGARKDLIRLIEEGASKLEKLRTILYRMK
jgi:gas vesicle protein